MSEPEKPTPAPKDWMSYVKDGVTVLGGVTALLVAFLWYVGRQYLRGYFDAFGIGIGEVSPSIWEYGEAGILHVAFSLATVAFISLISLQINNSQSIQRLRTRILSRPYGGLLVLCGLVLLYIISIARMSPDNPGGSIMSLITVIAAVIFLDIPDKTIAVFAQSTTNFVPKFAYSALTSFLMFILLAHILFFVQSLSYAGGLSSGSEYVTEQASGIRLVLSEPILIDQQATTFPTGNGASAFVYDELYYLQRNDTYYFLFKSITLDCTPERVYIIPIEMVKSIEVIDVPPIRPNCGTMPTQTQVPTLTPTSLTLTPRITATPDASLPALPSPAPPITP